MTPKVAGALHAPPAATGRIAGLDLIRGVAIALVMIRHAWPSTIGAAGSVGVAVFFTLSGYLITGILLRGIRTHGAVDFRRFYRNRLLRLYPPLLLLVVGLTVVSLTIDPIGDRGVLGGTILVALAYLGDVPMSGGSDAIGHLWTLAVEEQFYLVWPVLLMLAARRKRLGVLVIVVGALILLLLTLSVLVLHQRLALIYKLPTSWVLAMLIGAASAIWLPQVERAVRAVPLRLLGVVGVIGTLGLAALPEDKGDPLLYFVVGPAAALFTAALIVHMRTWQELPTRWLQPLLWLGTVSYAAYLWDFPLSLWLVEVPGGPVLSIGATIAAATASWWLLERPVQALKARLDERASSRSAVRTPISPVEG